MDVKILYQLKSEMDRIYARGLRLARNNPYIVRTLPVLEKYVDDDVAYNNLVFALKELIQAKITDSVDVLSTIYTSLYYLLRLHGEVIASDEVRTPQVPILNMNDIPVQQYTFLELKPLIEALTESGKNRLETIKKACEEKRFDDFRTYSYFDKALADKQPEVVELVEDIIKNDLKEKMLPFLLSSFECNDDNANLKRFDLFLELQYEGLNELLDEILESSAIALQIKVMQYISNNVAYENRIVELTESPQKLLREVAFQGLANLKTEKSEKKLWELYAKVLNAKKKNRGDIELLSKSLSQTELRYVFDNVLIQVKDLFNNIIVANKKANADLFYTLKSGISILKQGNRIEVCDFFFELLSHTEYNEIIKKCRLIKPATEVTYAIIDSIQYLNAEQRAAFSEKVIKEMDECEWKKPFYKMYLHACVDRGDSAEKIYDMFAPHYLNRNISIDDIMQHCCGDHSRPLDSRWTDRLYESLEHVDEQENVEVLLRVLDALELPSSERYNEKLIRAGKETKKYLLEITSAIMRHDLSDKYEVVFSLVKHCHDRGASGSNALRQLLRATYWEKFPKEYAAKFRELKNAPRAIYTKIVES